MLKKYLKVHKLTYQEFADKIGISKQAVSDILKNKSPHTKVRTCMAIKQITGLEPYEYLNGLEAYKNLYEKSKILQNS
jgi:transcriptional regulator with XRE-family HTH domain